MMEDEDKFTYRSNLIPQIKGLDMQKLCKGLCDREQLILKDAIRRLAEFEELGYFPKEIQDIDYALLGVMHSVDKFLSDEDIKNLHPVVRGTKMREQVLQEIESLEQQIKALKESACMNEHFEPPKKSE